MGPYSRQVALLHMSRTWLCPCGTKNERIKRKCVNPTCSRSRPKPRVPKHAQTLRDQPYAVFELINGEVHGPAHGGEWDASCCGVCGRPPSQDRHNDRDHGHLRGSLTYGKPRGLACGGNHGCNVLMLPWVTAETARGIADAKTQVGEPDAPLWVLIAGYLERIDEWYRNQA